MRIIESFKRTFSFRGLPDNLPRYKDGGAIEPEPRCELCRHPILDLHHPDCPVGVLQRLGRVAAQSGISIDQFVIKDKPVSYDIPSDHHTSAPARVKEATPVAARDPAEEYGRAQFEYMFQQATRAELDPSQNLKEFTWKLFSHGMQIGADGTRRDRNFMNRAPWNGMPLENCRVCDSQAKLSIYDGDQSMNPGSATASCTFCGTQISYTATSKSRMTVEECARRAMVEWNNLHRRSHK